MRRGGVLYGERGRGGVGFRVRVRRVREGGVSSGLGSTEFLDKVMGNIRTI